MFKNFFITQKNPINTNTDKKIYKNPVLMFFNSVSYNQALLHQYTFEIFDASIKKTKLLNSYATEARILGNLKYFNFLGNTFFL